jgi:hypothetical protein
MWYKDKGNAIDIMEIVTVAELKTLNLTNLI